MIKQTYIVKHFQTDVEKHFSLSYNKFVQSIYSFDFQIRHISQYRNALKMVFSVPFLLR